MYYLSSKQKFSAKQNTDLNQTHHIQDNTKINLHTEESIAWFPCSIRIWKHFINNVLPYTSIPDNCSPLLHILV